MSQFSKAVSFVLIGLLLAMTAKAGENVRMNASVSGAALMVIQAAMPKFEEQGLDLGKYEVHVVEEEASFVVIFTDPNRPSGQRGSTLAVPTFEVEVGKTNLNVIKAYFAR